MLRGSLFFKKKKKKGGGKIPGHCQPHHILYGRQAGGWGKKDGGEREGGGGEGASTLIGKWEDV